MLACYFQALSALVASLLFMFTYQEGGSAFAPCCHPVPHGEPSGKAANASLACIIRRAWFGCLFSLHSSVAASTRQYGTCSCVGKGMYWECRWENVKSRKYLASCSAEHHSQLETTWLAFTHRYWKWQFLLPAKRSKNTIFYSRNKKTWLTWARAQAVDMVIYPPVSLLSSLADPSAFASLQCWILLA